MPKFFYSSGLPGYGTQGNDGSIGLTGLSIFVSDMNSVTDQTTITSRITANKTLIISSSDNIPGYPERIYQSGDLFVDVNLAICEIDLTAVNKYTLTGLSLESGSAIFQERDLAPNANFDRYTNNITDSPYKIVDVAYGLSLSDFYATGLEVYDISAGNYAQVFCSNYDVHANNKIPYILYTSNTDEVGQFAIIREASSNTFRIGNKDQFGVIRDVSLAFDFKNININSTVLDIDSSTSNFRSNINFNSNTTFNAKPYFPVDISILGGIDFINYFDIRTTDVSSFNTPSISYLRTGNVLENGGVSGDLYVATGNIYSAGFSRNYVKQTLETGDIKIYTGQNIDVIYDATTGTSSYITKGGDIHLISSKSSGNYRTRWTNASDGADGIKNVGITGAINIGSAQGINTYMGEYGLYSAGTVTLTGCHSGDVSIGSGNGGLVLVDQTSGYTSAVAGNAGHIIIAAGRGGDASINSLLSPAGYAADGGIGGYIYIYTSRGGYGMGSGANGNQGHVTMQFNPNSNADTGYNVYIGRDGGPVGYRFEVQDPAPAVTYGYYDGAGNWGSSSDKRLKTNITTIEGALDKINNIRGVKYNVIDSSVDRLGVIAQEIIDYIPEVVSQDAKGYYGVGYTGIIPVLIQAIKEQQEIINELKAKIDKL